MQKRMEDHCFVKNVWFEYMSLANWYCEIRASVPKEVSIYTMLFFMKFIIFSCFSPFIAICNFSFKNHRSETGCDLMFLFCYSVWKLFSNSDWIKGHTLKNKSIKKLYLCWYTEFEAFHHLSYHFESQREIFQSHLIIAHLL